MTAYFAARSGLILLLLLILDPPALAGIQSPFPSIQYDTSKCATDPHEMVYFALGRRVFRQPVQNLSLSISSDLPQEVAKLPTPPKPSDPAGCPDHPLQGLTFTFGHFWILPNTSGQSSAEQLETGGGIELVYDNDGTNVGLQSVNEELYKTECSKYHLTDLSVPGIVGCKIPLPVESHDQRCQSEEYQAKPDFYTAPGGRLFTAGCLIDWLHKPCRNICGVSYKFSSDLNVWYKADMSKFEVKDLVPFDQKLQRAISAAEIPNYPWPDKQLKMEKAP